MTIVDPFDTPGPKAGIKDPFSSQPDTDYGMGSYTEPTLPTTPNEVLSEETAGYSPLKKFLIGTGQGFVEAGRGIEQLYYGATGQKGKLAETTAAGTQERQMLEPLGGWGQAGSIVGQTAPGMAIPGGVAGGALRRAGTAGLSGALQGGLGFVPEGGSRGMNAMTGGAGGAVGSGMISGAGKVWNAMTGRVPPMGNKWNIPTTLSEETRGIPSRTDVLLERAPGIFGTKAFRERQHDAAFQAAQKFLADYIANPLGQTVESNRAFVKGLYDEFKSILKGVPQEIRPVNTQKTAQDLLDQFPEVFEKLQDRKSKAAIMDILKGTTPESGAATQFAKDTTGGLFPPGMGPTGKSSLNYRSFDDMWQLRQALGENLGFAKRELNRTNYNKYKDLWLAVSKDMDEWSKAIGRPDVLEKFRGANDAYKHYVVKHHAVQQAYDKSINELGQNTYFSPQKFATNLKKIIEKDKVMGTFKPGEIEEMAGLANIMQVVKRAGQYTENPPTGNRWGALTMGGMAEAAMFKAGGVAGMLKGTALAGVTAGAMKFITTTNPGKKLALAASKVNPDSPAMKAIVNSIYRQAPKYMASAGQDNAKPRGPIEDAILGDPSSVEEPSPTPINDPTKMSFEEWSRQEHR